MSEYQYYQFLALDRPLSDDDQKALRAISTRAEITRHSFTNVYHWGDLKARSDDLVDQYFDAHLYITNWGIYSCQLRIPRANLPPGAVTPYQCGTSLQARTTETHVIVTWTRHDEDPVDYWEEEEAARLTGLIPLRTSLLQGDLRALYLGWLLGVQQGDVDTDESEPPLPPGLQQLDGPLWALAELLNIDVDLLAAAAVCSPDRETIDLPAVQHWLANTPNPTKDEWLLVVMRGEGGTIPATMWQRFRQSQRPVSAPASPRRTAGDLIEAAATKRHLRQEREAQEAADKARTLAAARQRHLASLAGQEATLWNRVEQAIHDVQQADYDTAVKILVDLHDLGKMTRNEAHFTQGIAALRKRYSRRQGLWQRLRDQGLYS